MRQKTISTGVCTLLAVEVPEGTTEISIDFRAGRICCYTNKWEWIWSPPGNWRLLCKVCEVTEDITENLVDYEWEEDEWIRFYRDYESENCIHFLAPIQSFNSLLRANGIDWDFSRTYLFKLIEQ